MFAILNSSLSFLFLSHFVTSREKERERVYEMEFEKTALKQKKVQSPSKMLLRILCIRHILETME